MVHPSYTILYVDNPPASVAFYSSLFAAEPVEASPTFGLFVLDGGLRFGLWSKHTVEPAASAPAGGMEIGIAVSAEGDVGVMHSRWVERGLPILQAPTRMDFGLTFVALDPDGHRLRVFCPCS